MAPPNPPPDPSQVQEPSRERKSWLEGVVRRPVAVTMFVLSMAVFGAVSFAKLRVDLLPEISYPTLTVRTGWPGAAPEDVEQRISEKVQEALSTLDDLVRSTSISRAGASDVVLEFDWGTPMTFAVEDVREKLGGVFLPDGAELPLILRFDPNLDPILRIGVSSPDGREPKGEEEIVRELLRLRWLAENRIQRELEAIEGVAAVQVRGGLEEEIRVRVDPQRLSALRIDPGELAARLAAENINASGGSLREGSAEFLVRTVNQFRDVDEIEEMPVSSRGAAVVRVRDVARVERTHERREVVSRIGGRESVEVAIYREAGANVVQVAGRVKERVFGTREQQAAAREYAEKEERGEGGAGPTLGERRSFDYLAWNLREDAQMEPLSDQSVFIEDAVDDVKSSAVLGSFLAIGVIWLFLRRFPPTLIIGLSIPVSVVVTFAPMFLSEVSLNIMSLGGLALGVGMMVDNAIVVLESVTRCRDEGDSIVRAAVRGTAEVVGAVTASTLTTVAVFAPIVFVTGVAGQIFGDQALTVVSALVVSLVFAILFIPVLASRPWLVSGLAHALGAAGTQRPGYGEPALRLEGTAPPGPPPRIAQGLDWRERPAASAWVFVGRSLLVLLGWLFRLAALGAAALAWTSRKLTAPLEWLFARLWSRLERRFPRFLAGALQHPWLVLAAAAGLLWVSLVRLGALGLELLPQIHQGEFTAHVRLSAGSPLENTDTVLSELDRAVRRLPAVATTALTVGIERETLSREIEGPNTARLLVRLEEAARDPVREEEITGQVRALLAAHPAVDAIEIARPTPFALEAPIAVEVKGYDLAKLAQVSQEVQRRLSVVPGLSDVRTTLRPGYPEARITFDREKMLELGLDLGAVSGLVRDQVLGNVSTRFHEGDERIGIRVIGDEVVLDTLEALRELPVNPAAENSVSLGTVATIELERGPAEIRRIGNTRAVVVSAATSGVNLGGMAARITDALASLSVPEDVTVELGGQKREMDQAQESMRFALYLAIFLVYVVMASQFESLVQPLVILLTVPLAAVGVVLTLDALDVPLSVVVFIGLILLAGIVVNNAIVLIDRINQVRARGLDMRAAILDAAATRLRPILMTAGTTVLGLLPMTGWLRGVPVIGALGAGAGAEIRAPMAITVISGLVSSTVLTLIVIPVVYSLVERLVPAREPEAAG
jgi:HAE1 family hydrophobic/amphiphilic exporter-1